MSELGKCVLLRGHSAKDHCQDHQQRGQIALDGFSDPQDYRSAEYGQHRVAGPYEGGLTYDGEPCLGLRRQPGKVKVVE